MSRLKSLSDQSSGNHPGVRFRRLPFQSWHRGTQESDLILGGSPKSAGRIATPPNSTGSKLCSIAPIPTCSTGSSAGLQRRRNTTTT
jgi:hypothetical protein